MNILYSFGLHINTKKTKCIIFNKSGKVLTNFHFYLYGNEFEITDNYQYLAAKVRPSGIFTFAADELCSKARNA